MKKSATVTGLRGRQKEKRRAAIISAARQLFEALGYQNTSMEAIAEAAEVGVATVYNYFGSKGKLLADILRPEFQALYDQGDELLSAPPADPADGVLELIRIYRHFQDDWHSRRLLTAVIGPGLTAEPVLDELTIKAEAEVKRQLAALLEDYQQRNLLRAEIAMSDAAVILFSVFNQHYIEYVTNDEVQFEDMSECMDRQLRLFVALMKPG
ncbi:TetR/AcrR family transcriptional regulator [Haliea sp.]